MSLASVYSEDTLRKELADPIHKGLRLFTLGRLLSHNEWASSLKGPPRVTGASRDIHGDAETRRIERHRNKITLSLLFYLIKNILLSSYSVQSIVLRVGFLVQQGKGTDKYGGGNFKCDRYV